MDADHTRSLTYAEMASVMGITLASAKNLTRRKRWPRTRSNEGSVRILVPLEYLESGRHEGPSASPPESLVGGGQDVLVAIADMQRRIVRLEAAGEAAETALATALDTGE